MISQADDVSDRPPTGTADLDRSFGFLLADALRSARRDFAQRALGLKVTPALARLLYHVDRHPGSHQKTLAARLEITPVTLGRMVDRLVERRLVRRSEDEGDRRAVRLYLEPAGRPLLDKVDEIRRDTEVRALAGLTDHEQRDLLRLLGRVCANLGEPKAGA